MSKNIYFASDFHLGTPNYNESRGREERIVNWLNFIEPTCSELFLMGDIFDFWFEYAKVIPKGFIRLQGKLATMADAGIKIYFFKGNHDMWVRDYFTQEIGMEIISDEKIIERNGRGFTFIMAMVWGREMLSTNFYERFSEVNFASGCLPVCIQISALALQMPGARGVGQRKPKKKFFWGKIKNGSPFMPKSSCKNSILITSFLATGICRWILIWAMEAVI